MELLSIESSGTALLARLASTGNDHAVIWSKGSHTAQVFHTHYTHEFGDERITVAWGKCIPTMLDFTNALEDWMRQ
jgi:hypothetical protein